MDDMTKISQLEERCRELEKANEEQKKQILEMTELNNTLQERMSVIQSMSKVYFSSFFVNLRDNSFFEINNTDFVRKYTGKMGNAQETFWLFCDNMVRDDFKLTLRRFADFSTLDMRMANKSVITCDYIGNVAGWCQLFFIEGERDTDGSLKTVFVASRTIHDEKMREEENKRALEEARDIAEVANKAKTMFLNNMSHDIRTPMNAILGFAELMEREKDNPEIVSQYLMKIRNSGEYLLSIINNILDMARIESDSITIDEEVIDLMDVESVAMVSFEDIMRSKGHKFVVTNSIKHRYIIADKAKVQQITMNLLSNAVKYTPDSGEIHMNMDELPCDKAGYSTYRMVISDNGIGMSPEFVEHIFDYFSRERNTTESRIIGTGLGMSIVKKIVDLLGGTIEIESTPGVGSKFIVTFVHKIEENPKEFLVKRDRKLLDLSGIIGKRILLAEDNELNAEIAIAILENEKLIVEHARDGIECFDMIYKSDSQCYDLILMDIQMPNLNGYDATKKIRALEDERKAKIPIIAMTANAFEEDRQNAFEAGMNGHLSKPIDVTELLEALLKYLG